MSDYAQTCLLFAARYAFNRKTGAAYVVIKVINREWDNLSKELKQQLKREASKATANKDEWKEIVDKVL